MSDRDDESTPWRIRRPVSEAAYSRNRTTSGQDQGVLYRSQETWSQRVVQDVFLLSRARVQNMKWPRWHATQVAWVWLRLRRQNGYGKDTRVWIEADSSSECGWSFVTNLGARTQPVDPGRWVTNSDYKHIFMHTKINPMVHG
jgi:hypothetical protein